MKQPCLEAGCPDAAVYRGRCRGHSRKREKQTHRNKGIYNSKRWRMLRKRVLFEQSLCEREGCMRIAVDVDHIVPIEEGGAPFERANCQALCRPHHGEKTAGEVRARS